MNNTPWSPEIYCQAYWFAAQAHQGQTIRDTDLPYIVHPGLVCMEVMAALLAEPGRAEDLAVQCALLHDVIEDSAVTVDQWQSQFGAEVAAGVQALSKDPQLLGTEQLSDSLRRIQQQPPEVWLVKLAGYPVREINQLAETEVIVVGIVRDGRRLPAPSPFEPIDPGDLLIVRADSDDLKALVDAAGLELVGSKDLAEADLRLARGRASPANAAVGIISWSSTWMSAVARGQTGRRVYTFIRQLIDWSGQFTLCADEEASLESICIEWWKCLGFSSGGCLTSVVAAGDQP